MKRNAITLALVASAAIGLAGCRQDMHDTPRYETFEATGPTTPGVDNRSVRALPAGTVARGWLREDDALYTGKVNGVFVDQFPFAIGHDELERGHARFNIYCTPCHGRLGDGQGMVVQRGLRQAASYHNDRLRAEKVGYFFDVVTNGFGAMQGYAEQIPVRDRWLIIAYVRALQLSQHATLEDVPADRRGQLNETAAGTEKPAAAAPEKR